MICKVKQAKPYPDYPLTWHAGNRQWLKKIKGKQHYFGADADKALASYLDCRDDLHAGREPKAKQDVLTVGELCNRFLLARRADVTSGELSAKSWHDYAYTSKLVIAALGRTRTVEDLGPADFASLRAKLGEGRAATTLAGHVTRTRVMLRWAADNELLKQPVRMGANFREPSKSVLRKHRAASGGKMLEIEQVLTLLESADVTMRAMILLGLNCGYGNADVGRLRNSMLDLEAGWAAFTRPKTGIARKAALWPETVAAVKVAIAQRPKPMHRADDDRVFLTRTGLPYCKEVEMPAVDGTAGPCVDNPVTRAFAKLAARLGLAGKGFYHLRHVCETIGGGSRDQVAVNHIMGHADASMASVYRERIDDGRLIDVAEHIRRWLYGDKAAVPPTHELAAV